MTEIISIAANFDEMLPAHVTIPAAVTPFSGATPV